MKRRSAAQLDRDLLRAAQRAAAHSYSPYSRFPVGAALRTAGGRIFVGTNVENASYGLTICAERVAMGAAIAAGCRRFAAMAVVGGKRRAARPCGACLQVIAEFCGPDFPVLVASSTHPDRAERLCLSTLLPQAFTLKRAGRTPA